MKVQARMLVPAWKRPRAAHAFNSVSWTRSSATSRLPESDRPNARRCGITAASSRLKSESESDCRSSSWCSASWPSPSLMGTTLLLAVALASWTEAVKAICAFASYTHCFTEPMMFTRNSSTALSACQWSPAAAICQECTGLYVVSILTGRLQ